MQSSTKAQSIDASSVASEWQELQTKSSGFINNRLNHFKSVLSGKHVFIFDNPQNYQNHRYVYIFNLETQTWDAMRCPGMSNVLERANEYNVSVDSEGNLVLFGGIRGQQAGVGGLFGGGPNQPYRTEIYLDKLIINSTSEKVQAEWRQIPCQGALRYRRGYTINIHQDRMYVFGGQDEQNVYTNSLFSFDLKTQISESVTTIGSRPEPRGGHRSVIHDGKLYIYGGRVMMNGGGGGSGSGLFGGPAGGGSTRMSAEVWSLDLASLTWKLIDTSSLGKAPESWTAANSIGDKIIFFGRNVQQGLCNNALAIYDPDHNTWETPTGGININISSSTTCVAYDNKLMLGMADKFYSLDLCAGGNKTTKVTNSEGYKNTIESDDTDLRAKLRQLYDEMLFPDITFRVEGQQVSAHKCVLAAFWPYCQKMFASNMMESNSSVIDFPYIRADIFRGLLRYIYSNQLTLTEETANEFLEAADKYSLPKLRAACEQFITQHLKAATVIDTVILAERHDAANLRQACLKFIVKNIDEVFEHDDINRLQKSTQLELFKLKA